MAGWASRTTPTPSPTWGSSPCLPRSAPSLSGSSAASSPGPALRSQPPGHRLLERNSRFRAFLLPLAYGIIPVVGADYFARQLPKFFTFISTAIPSIGHPFGLGSTSSSLYNTSVLSGNSLVIAQLIVMAIGTIAAAWVTWRIADRDLVGISTQATPVRVASAGFAVACGAAAAYLYVLMHAAL